MTDQRGATPPRRWVLAHAATAFLVACSGNADPAGPDPDQPTHPTGAQVISQALGGRPFGVTVTAANLVLVSRLDDAAVSRYRLDPDERQVDIPVGPVPTDVSAPTTGSLAFVTNQGAGTAGILDVGGATQTATVPVGGDPFRVLPSPDGSRLYVSTNTSRIYVVNVAQRAVIDSIAAPASVNGLAISADGATLYAASPTADQVARISLATRQVTQTVSTANGAQEIVLSPAGDELYVAGLAGPVQVRRASDLALITTVAGSEGGFGMALTRDGTQLYVTVTLGGRVVVIDRAARTVAATLPTGGQPRRIAFSRRGDIAVVADEANRVLFIR